MHSPGVAAAEKAARGATHVQYRLPTTCGWETAEFASKRALDSHTVNTVNTKGHGRCKKGTYMGWLLSSTHFHLLCTVFLWLMVRFLQPIMRNINVQGCEPYTLRRQCSSYPHCTIPHELGHGPRIKNILWHSRVSQCRCPNTLVTY